MENGFREFYSTGSAPYGFHKDEFSKARVVAEAEMTVEGYRHLEVENIEEL